MTPSDTAYRVCMAVAVAIFVAAVWGRGIRKGSTHKENV